MALRTGTFEVLHASVIGLWIGAAVTAGAAAAVAFPTMHRLNPRLPDYQGYPGEHWLLAGGQVMAPIFGIAGWTQVVCLILAVVLFVVSGLGRVRGRMWLIRGAVLVALVAITGFQAGVLRPRMMRNLHEQWRAAQAGQQSTADVAKASFDSDHGLSNAVLAASVLLGVASVALTAWDAGRSPPEIAS
jgi:hypothetical protein